MSNHLTPWELARETGLDHHEVITTCKELGVPIFQGKIDKTLFAASLAQSSSGEPARAGDSATTAP
jgi:hypothetical protein